jgi:hypothetical protein
MKIVVTGGTGLIGSKTVLYPPNGGEGYPALTLGQI